MGRLAGKFVEKLISTFFICIVFVNSSQALESFSFEDPSVYMDRYLPKKTSEKDLAKEAQKQECKDELKIRKLPLSMEGFVKQIKKGDVEVVQLYINAGIDPNTTYYTDYPIYFAVQANNVEVTSVLLENGAKANIGFDSPLYFAIKKKNLALVQLLLEYGADPNYTDFISGSSVLYFALEKGQYEIAKELLASGAKMDSASKVLIEKKKFYDLIE